MFADFRHEYCICIISTLPFAPPTRPTFLPAPPLHIEAAFLLLLLSYVLTELPISVWFSFFLVDSLGFRPLIRMPCVSRNRWFFFSLPIYQAFISLLASLNSLRPPVNISGDSQHLCWPPDLRRRASSFHGYIEHKQWELWVLFHGVSHHLQGCLLENHI